ncbi:MAG: MGMT family protein [Nitrospirae bacterium]|nr:MGMT family protein [Nitrospirota bacterium]
MNVYRVLLEIPYGQTRSYKWVAERVGSPKASRAVGHALSTNPLPIIVPCHRVVASDGSLGGFSPSIEIKMILLDIEAGHWKPDLLLTRIFLRG